MRETGRGDITQFCYDAPARETTIRFRETEEYSLEDVADTLREHSDDVFIGDIAEALDFWGVAYEKNEKSGPSRVRDSPLLTRRTAHHLATCAPRALFVARRNHVRCGRSAGARVPRTSARPRVSRGGRGLLRGHGFACGPTAARLGPHAPAVCLWRRAQPCPLRRPGLSRASRMAHYGPRHLRPAAPRSPLPWLRLGSSLLRCAGGEAMSIVAESSDAAGPRPRPRPHAGCLPGGSRPRRPRVGQCRRRHSRASEGTMATTFADLEFRDVAGRLIVVECPLLERLGKAGITVPAGADAVLAYVYVDYE